MVDDPEPREEWRLVESDTDDMCVICGDTVHAWQAVGYVGGRVVHAKCYGERDERRVA
jgi:hypothetical protein